MGWHRHNEVRTRPLLLRSQQGAHTHTPCKCVCAVLHRHANMCPVTRNATLGSCMWSGAARRAHPATPSLSMHHSMPFPTDHPVPTIPPKPLLRPDTVYNPDRLLQLLVGCLSAAQPGTEPNCQPRDRGPAQQATAPEQQAAACQGTAAAPGCAVCLGLGLGGGLLLGSGLLDACSSSSSSGQGRGSQLWRL